MPLDFPQSAIELWALFDRGGPRPEYVLPVLYAESGFDASVQNEAGAQNFGVNQASPELIAAYAKTDPATFVTWPASKQISTVVRGMLLGLVEKYGPLRSATRAEQANFLPATLPSVTTLDGVLARFGDSVYSGNAALDTAQKGTIELQDLANFVARAAASPAVKSAETQVYASRPSESPREPVYGEDFGASSGLVSKLALAAGVGLLVWSVGRSL